MPKKVCETPGCENCPMRKLFPENNFVPARFGTGLRLMIAEAPGEQESIQGEPLVGGSGKWLRGGTDPETGKHYGGLIRQAGLQDESITYANIIQCRPPNNVFPTDPEARSYISDEDSEKSVRHCIANHLNPVLDARPWTRIDLLGDKALRFLTAKTGGISQWRGSPVAITHLGDTPLGIPTFHPAYIARDQRFIPAVISDLKKSTQIPPENYNLNPTLQDVQRWCDGVTKFAVDIEMDMQTGEITLVGLAKTPFEAIVIPFRGAYVSAIRQLFSVATEIIGHNVCQFDLPKLQAAGIHVPSGCIESDTMLMQHLVQPDLPHDLEFVSSIFTNKPAWKAGPRESGYWELRCARDVDVTLQAYNQLRPLLKAQGLLDLYQFVQVPLAKICHLMHTVGFKTNPNKINEVREQILVQMAELETQLPLELRTRHETVVKRVTLAPDEQYLSPVTGKPLKTKPVETTQVVVPWRSNDAVAHYLYDILGLPVQLHVKTQKVTTDKIALEKLYRQTGRRDIQAIRTLRKLSELETNFLKVEIVKVERMHASFNPHGTKSGRLSSSDPNLQNQPEIARIIYVPSHPGWKIVSADFSQIENRLTAYFANDSERLARFQKDPNFSEHKFAASKFFHIPYNEVEKDNDPGAPYNKAKHIVHGVNYAMGPRKIANMYDMDLKEVQELLIKWKQEIAPTIIWQQQIAESAKKQGYLETPFKRKRWFYTTNYYTESISFLPQSTAADIMFRAMIGLMYKRINWSDSDALRVVQVIHPLPEPANLLVQVHDSLVFECPSELVHIVVCVIQEVLEQPWRELGGFSVPVSIEVGDSWGQLETYNLS